jgi:YidC/Oxa1 family membrane protein insertase
MGPMRYRLLAAYEQNLYDMVDFGWDFFEVVTRPLARFVFIPAFEYLAMFIPNYGVIVILLAFLIKLILAPLTASSYRSMAKMKDLAPKMEEIKAKYGNDPKKQQEATMRMYRESGVNPAGGCLPMLLQYPVIIALWQFLPQSIEIRQQGFLWAPDLSAPDAVVNLPFEIPFYGDFISGFTVLMGLSMIVQMKIQSGATASTNPQMKVFMYLFPGMIFVIFNRLASGLSLYYLCFNVLTAAQQMYMNRNNQTAKPEEEASTQPKRHGKGVSKRAASGADRKKR